MSTPYSCGHTREEDHDDYCGVGACYVCMVTFERTGLYPHGALMKAERTLTISLADRVFDGVTVIGDQDRRIFVGRVCGDCTAKDVLANQGVDPSLIVETYV